MSPGEIVTEMLRSSDEGRFDAFHARLEPDCEWVNPMAQARGADEVVAALAAYGDAFPDRRHELSLVLEAGSAVVVEGAWVATHAAPLRTPEGEVPATGNTVRVPFAGVIHLRGDRVASTHVYLDRLGFQAQLGLAPAAA